jgi:hypothetical protein
MQGDFSSTLLVVTMEVVALFLEHPTQQDWQGLFTMQLADTN